MFGQRSIDEGIIYYINDDEGIIYEVQAGKVNTVEYGSTKKYEHFHCGDTVDQKAPLVRKIDT